MSLKFDAQDLARAVSAGVLQPGQDQRLLDFLRQQPETRASFQLAHVAYYFGALLIMGAMGIAVLLRRPLFMVFGALGVAGYLGYLASDVFEDSLLFPVALTLIGLGVIALGILYQKHRDSITDGLRTRLPDSLLNFLPALRR